VIENVPGHHQFLGPGAIDELVEAAPHGIRPADDGGAQRVGEDGARLGIEPGFEILDRRGHTPRPSDPVVQR